MAFPFATHAFNEEAYANRILNRLPECNIPIQFQTYTFRDAWGVYESGRITIKRGLNRRWIKYVLLHECGHELNETLDSPIFGRPPYVTREAKQDRAEDFAESYRAYKTGILRDGAKFNFFQNNL